MTLRLYKRACRVVVQAPAQGSGDWFGRLRSQLPGVANQVTIEGLQIRFKVEKTIGKNPNSAEVVITNLAQRSRAEFEAKPLSVTLYAGYDDDLRYLYSGDLRFGASTLRSPDWETTLQLGHGDRAFRLARVSKSYGAGASVLSVIRDCAATMGLPPPEFAAGSGAAQLASTQLGGGTTLSGASRDELTRLLAPYGYHWSIQDGRLQVLRDEEAFVDRAVAISQETGLVGTPEYGAPNRPGTKKGDAPTLKFQVQLYPGLSPGMAIRVRCRAVPEGTFKLTKVSHRGDTHGQDWLTECESRAL